MLHREEELRRQIAGRLVEEASAAPPPALSADHPAAADAAIANWEEQGEEEQDQRASWAMGPLQELLAEHRGLSSGSSMSGIGGWGEEHTADVLKQCRWFYSALGIELAS